MKNRAVLAAIGLVALAFGFYTLALKPKRQEASALQGQITQQQDALTKAQQLLATNTAARSRYQEAYSTVIRLGKAVPADDDVRSLVVQLAEAAKRTSVGFNSIDVGGGSGGVSAAPATGAAATAALPPGVTIGPAGFPVEPFSFAFTGSFFKLSDFLAHVQDYVNVKGDRLNVRGRLLTLDSLQLAPDGAGFPQIRATINATSYLVSPLEGLTAGATAAGPATAGSATAAAPAGSAAPSTGTTPAAPATGGSAITTATSTGVIR